MPIPDLQIKTWSEVITDDLREESSWTLIAVDPCMPWPVEVQSTEYRGDRIWILPTTTDCYPGVALKNSLGHLESGGRLLRFLSALSWVEGGGIGSNRGIGGGSSLWPPRLDRAVLHPIRHPFDLKALPEPNPKGSLALALMREGRSIGSKAYAFLTFFRVLEIPMPNGRKRKQWVNSVIPRLRTAPALETLGQLQRDGVADIGQHLFDLGRTAIAHAKRQPIIDPDDPTHQARMYSEAPIMEALAELAINDLLGIKTPHSWHFKPAPS